MSKKSELSFVEQFIENFTEPGDTVFDPFAGFGSTLFIAEKLGRIPFGIEIDEERYNFARSHLKMKDNIIHGDSRRLNEYQIPQLDLVYTSPLFMYSDETMNPLSLFKEEGNYQDYLEDLQRIFRMTSELLRPRGKVIVGVYNLGANEEQPLTLLAWDMTRALSEVLRFEKEIIICWQEEDESCFELFGYNHFYCLVFEK